MSNSILARILYLLHSGSHFEVVRRHIEGFMGGPCTITSFDPSGRMPRMTYARCGKDRLLLLGGVPSRAVATAFVTGYVYSDFGPSPYGFHPICEEAFGQVQGYLQSIFQDTGYYQVVIAGYSYGGAIASNITPVVINWNRNANVKTVTFGAPRAFLTTDWLDENQTWNAWRIMNVRDPIPLLPPNPDESIGGYLLYPAVGRERMASWSHYGTGEKWDENNTAVRAEVPDPSAVPPAYSIIGWAAGVLSDPVNEHSIATYAARMEQWTPDVLNPAPLAPPPNGMENRGFEPSHTNPFPPELGMPGVDPVMPVKIRNAIAGLGGEPEEKPYYAVKMNGTWTVFYRATFLVACKGRREANKIARDFNQIVRVVEDRVGADPDAMGGSIIEHFVAG